MAETVPVTGGKRAKVLAVANQKGGVGKTTTTVSLAAALARKGQRVLVLDLDPHACASVHLRMYPEQMDASVLDIFQDDPGDAALLWRRLRKRYESQNFDVVPAGIRLSELEVDLRNRPGKGAILKTALEQVREEYDFILLDCPPHVGILLVNALVAADLVIIPTQTDFLALHGLKLIFDTMKTLNKVLPRPISYRILPTLYDRRTRACARVLELLTEKMKSSLFTTVIGMDTRFRDASARGRVIYDIAPSSRGAREYEALSEEILAL